MLLLGFAWLGYVLWEAGIVGMFAVSMPWGETDMLACSERYMITGHVYMFGLMVLSAVESVNEWPPAQPTPQRIGAIALALVCAFGPVAVSGFPGKWGERQRNRPVREYFAALNQKHDLQDADNLMLVTDTSNQYYLVNKYIQTDFLAENSYVFSTADEDNPMDVVDKVLELASEFEIMLINTTNTEVQRALAKALAQGEFAHLKVYWDLDFVRQ